MSRNKKLIILNLIIAIICVTLYVIFTPHSYRVDEFFGKNYHTTVETIPLKTKEVIYGALYLFVLVCIPTIVYVLKQIILKLFIDTNKEVK